MERNVECKRCGHRWFAEQYAERDILPRYCPRCYREDIGEIPEEPSVVEKQVQKVQDAVHRVPGIMARWEKKTILWWENNTQLIEMGLFVMGLGVIFYIIYLFIFVWG